MTWALFIIPGFGQEFNENLGNSLQKKDSVDLIETTPDIKNTRLPGSISFMDSVNLASSQVFTPKTPGKAVCLSLVNTFLPAGIGILSILSYNHSIKTGDEDPDILFVGLSGIAEIAYGVIAGPSIGNLYAKDELRGISGMFIRGAGATILLVSWYSSPQSKGGILIGSGLILGSAVYNISSAAKLVEKYNRIHVGKAQVFITPAFSVFPAKMGIQVTLKI